MLKKPRKDWFFREWTQAVGVRFPHAWLQDKLGYSDGKASNVLSGKKRYDRDLVNEIADALNIQPAELLMHPSEAMALRQQRAAAITIAAQPQPSEAPAPVDSKKRA